MLYIVLLLVLAALGLLVPALTTSQHVWAWLSVGASGAAAFVLVLDWWLRRRSTDDQPAAPTAVRTTAVGATTPDLDHQASPDDQDKQDQGGTDTPISPDQGIEPPEEDTDAADLLIVTDLTTEVHVLDERPRYHLTTCTWLASRTTLALPIDEARQLGFTPCATCHPDNTLAEAHRTSARP
ncbi:hypothetical protein [Umezawaea sp. Da 62-37]|uniref:hypothetical protein n=1 Tax=Umezawaea sp. Da 62-37 TaxID=3075927 RepID=UPI0028F70F93|nr:hypothetical protein [Umezawaea sp. Da 62-37]WNV89714.1 hypothetical protein RM788_15840 [Umezawaea sp. Da 62-37]